MSAPCLSVVAFCGVTLALGGRTVLAGVDLAIASGEFVGVLGPNGAGKTTFMRAVLGLVPPAAGAIQVLGRPAARGNPAIGYMPQARAATAELRLRGRDFVAAAVDGQRWGLPFVTAAQRRQVDWALDMVGAETLAERPLSDLSGGERQRLLLAQALLGRPQLLLLDEPLISLDPQHQHAVVALADRLRRQLGIAVLFSAHELNPLLGSIDRVLYLARGGAAIGGVDEIVTGPVLSRLYGVPVEVMRMHGRIFVLAGEPVAEPAHV